MAVTFVIATPTGSLLAVCAGQQYCIRLATEFTEAVEDIYSSALIELGLILFLHYFLRAGTVQNTVAAPRPMEGRKT